MKSSRFLRPLVAVAVCAAGALAQTAAPVESTIRARLDSLDARSSFYAKQLSSGKEIAIRADEPMPNGERYTRGGSLRLDEKHQLVDTDGRPLLGEKGIPLKLTDGPIAISKTGEVSQGGQVVDRLRMEAAPKGAELTREGQSLWVPPATKEVMKPEARNVKQGYVEESNVNSMTSLVDMVAVQRAYASVQKAIVEMDHANETITTQIAKPL
jgi:flagellar basal body rod protein FlgG